jgi:hypothetical protein
VTTLAPPSLVHRGRSPRGPRSIPLNSFQMLMRKWCVFGPYNAGQVMHVRGEPDVARWRRAIDLTLAALHLGLPQFSVDGKVVTFHPAPPPEITPIEGNFDDAMSVEMNRPFAEMELPIRFFLAPQKDDTYFLAAVYDHWIGDSRAMRLLMQRFVQLYQGIPLEDLVPLAFPKRSFLELFKSHLGRAPVFTGVLESMKNLSRHFKACRINLGDPLDFSARCVSRELPIGLIDRVRARAKADGGSVNDFFLAVLSRVMGRFTKPSRLAHRRHGRTRDGVGLGTIVDIREAADESLAAAFGLYLSSYTIVLKQPEGRPADVLVKEISQHTARLKKTFGTVKSYMSLVVANHWWNFIPSEKNRALMFQKNVPLTAGISNVNLTHSWIDSPPPGTMPLVLDYRRISPTGPLIPLVFTLTTIGSRLSLYVTWRRAAFTDEQAQIIIDAFIQDLTEAA